MGDVFRARAQEVSKDSFRSLTSYELPDTLSGHFAQQQPPIRGVRSF